MKMIQVHNNLIPVGEFTGMALFFLLFLRLKDGKRRIPSPEYLNHELIHCKQWLECILLGIVIFGIVYVCFTISIWWIFSTIASFYVFYVLFWLLEIARPPYDAAYEDICFEDEARMNEMNLNYLKGERKWFAWFGRKYWDNKNKPRRKSSI